uniref:DNA-directed RNA polymerase n=1 Tax=Heterorhabditis bacteriophora TaxID=37862 RepID=A0A1I7XJW3_HETBA
MVLETIVTCGRKDPKKEIEQGDTGSRSNPHVRLGMTREFMAHFTNTVHNIMQRDIVVNAALGGLLSRFNTDEFALDCDS